VEALVDNSDRQLLIDSDDLIIKKSIDKDSKVHIRINDKHYSQSEYYNLLEIVGIRRHEPINFSMQGRIKRIAQSDENTLFELLTEIVGTKSYEERKKESLEILDTVQIDEKKADELLEDFRLKLNELEIDKEDFQKYEESLKAGNR